MGGLPAYPLARSWIGAILALLVLVLDVVFLALGQIDLKPGLLIGGLALAVLL
jgi:hypothetical protein